MLWVKNDSVREGVSDSARFIKSPDCTKTNHYNESLIFGKQFLNVTKIIDFGQYIDDSELLHKSILEKYHEVTFNSGNKIKLIVRVL